MGENKRQGANSCVVVEKSQQFEDTSKVSFSQEGCVVVLANQNFGNDEGMT